MAIGWCDGVGKGVPSPPTGTSEKRIHRCKCGHERQCGADTSHERPDLDGSVDRNRIYQE